MTSHFLTVLFTFVVLFSLRLLSSPPPPLTHTTQRLQDQDKQLASLQRELSEATTTITTLTDQLEGVGQVGVSHNSEVKVQTLERELNTEIERRKIVRHKFYLVNLWSTL